MRIKEPRIYLAVFLGLLVSVSPAFAQSVKKGSVAPDFSLALSNGTTVKLSDYRGQAVLLHFWATWCPPCRAELPEMDKLAQELAAGKNAPLAFLAVCVSDKESARADFMKQNGYTFPGGLDAGDAIAMKYQVQGIPMSLLIAPDGTIENIHVGAMRPSQLARFIRPYVK